MVDILVAWNVRLAHLLCNQADYGWRMKIRRMLEKGMSLERSPRTEPQRDTKATWQPTWTATSVRKAFVS